MTEHITLALLIIVIIAQAVQNGRQRKLLDEARKNDARDPTTGRYVGSKNS